MELFRDRQGDFRPAKAMMYGKEQDIRYSCTDLLWGQKHYQKLRFVLVEYGG